MITLKQPTLSSHQNKARLNAEVDVDGVIQNVWFEVDAAYGSYLCYERCDAFLIGLLHWAMLHHHDIVCEAPVGEELLFQLRTCLIPALARNSAALSLVNIQASLDSESLPNAGAVGTGISCGVDSFHVVATQANSPYPHLKLTHLALTNVGSHGVGEKGRRAFEEHTAFVEAFCNTHGFKLVLSDSNIAEVFPQNFLVTHTFAAMFAVYALQKFWRVYFYASAGTGISSFSLTNSEHFSSSRYDILSLQVFSTSSLKVYSAGSNETRIEKLRIVADYPPAHRFLNVCGRFPSCNTCRKCKRTLLELYAIGRLDDFKESFDVNYFKNHLSWYLIRFLSKYWQGDAYYVSIYPLLRDKISWPVWFAAAGQCGIHALIKRVKKSGLSRPMSRRANEAK